MKLHTGRGNEPVACPGAEREGFRGRTNFAAIRGSNADSSTLPRHDRARAVVASTGRGDDALVTRRTAGLTRRVGSSASRTRPALYRKQGKRRDPSDPRAALATFAPPADERVAPPHTRARRARRR